MGNLDSISRAIEECGGNPVISNQTSDFKDSSLIILPGVGSFNRAMENIRKLELDSIIFDQVVDNKKPLLGICLGMQIFATKGFEGGETKGLGFIEGQVIRLRPDSPQTRVPHVGWNEVQFRCDCPLFKGLTNDRDFYFVHSYHFVCKYTSDILAQTPYCGGFTSVIGRENIFGVQFHPEKSQRAGFQLIKNFLAL